MSPRRLKFFDYCSHAETSENGINIDARWMDIYAVLIVGEYFSDGYKSMKLLRSVDSIYLITYLHNVYNNCCFMQYTHVCTIYFSQEQSVTRYRVENFKNKGNYFPAHALNFLCAGASRPPQVIPIYKTLGDIYKFI